MYLVLGSGIISAKVAHRAAHVRCDNEKDENKTDTNTSRAAATSEAGTQTLSSSIADPIEPCPVRGDENNAIFRANARAQPQAGILQNSKL